MTAPVFRTIIAPVAAQGMAQALCAAFSPEAGVGMLTTLLAPQGSQVPTLCVSSGGISPAFADLLPLTTLTTTFGADSSGEPTATTTTTTRPGNAAQVVELAAQLGMPVPLAYIEALLASIDVSAQEPFEAFARLGVHIVQPEGL
jgi:hypothetical protein